MNNKIGPVGHIVITLVILLFIFFISYFLIFHVKETHAFGNATQVTENEFVTGKHDVYIDWILSKSSKISKSTAVDIYSTAMSMENGLLLVAMAARESSFNPGAISKKGAVGLNQIMPGVWTKELKEQGIIQEERDLFDYKMNLAASKYILIKYYKLTGSWKKALVKYVGGSRSYARDVLANYGELQLLKTHN